MWPPVFLDLTDRQTSSRRVHVGRGDRNRNIYITKRHAFAQIGLTHMLAKGPDLRSCIDFH